jgi:hypothetical protein
MVTSDFSGGSRFSPRCRQPALLTDIHHEDGEALCFAVRGRQLVRNAG